MVINLVPQIKTFYWELNPIDFSRAYFQAIYWYLRARHLLAVKDFKLLVLIFTA